jgi:hypothetical protein
MKKSIFILSIIIAAIFSSCKDTEVTWYSIQNSTNDTVVVNLILNGSRLYGSRALPSDDTMNFLDSNPNTPHGNPFDADVHLIYKGKEYVENSLTGNSIRHKDAYQYTKTNDGKGANANYYYFYITEEYILSLPEVVATE